MVSDEKSFKVCFFFHSVAMANRILHGIEILNNFEMDIYVRFGEIPPSSLGDVV